MGFNDEIASQKTLMVEQRRELTELLGIETRNKYAVLGEDGKELGFCAEQQKGMLGILLRQLVGHWRTFDIFIFDRERKQVLTAHHPMRWIFQRLEITTADGRFLGAIQQRFAILTKRFDVEDGSGTVRMTVSSPLTHLWTFPFERDGRTVAVVSKKWSGILTEAFTDKDKFRVEYQDPTLTLDERLLILAASLFIDLQYFERKAQ